MQACPNVAQSQMSHVRVQTVMVSAVVCCRAIEELKRRAFVESGQQVAIVQSGRQPIWRSASTHVISVREVPLDPEPDEL